MVSTPFGRRPRISAAAYTGRAVAPGAVSQPDPVTTNLITRNSLQLGVVANQIQGLTAQMQSLTGSLQVIGGSLRQQQNLLAQREQTEQELENRLAQQKLREGKESVIEKKIQASALAPAEKITSKAQFTLGRLGNFFLTLLGGWLLTASIQLLQKYGDEVRTKFNQIKEFSIDTFNVISGIVGTIADTINNVSNSLQRLATKIKELATTGVFSDLVGQITSVVTNAAQDAANTAGGFLGLTPFPERKEETKAEKEEEGGGEPQIDPATPPGQEPSKNVFQDLFEKGMDFFGGNSMFNPENLGKGGPSMAEPMETMMGDTKFTFDIGEGEIDLSNPLGAEGKTTKIDPATTELSMVEPQETAMGKPVEKPAEKKEESEQVVDPETPAKYGEKSLQVEEGSKEAQTTEPQVEGDGKQTTISIEGDPSKKVSPGDTTLSDMGFTPSEIKGYIDEEKYIGKTGKLPPSMMKFDGVSKSKEIAQRVSAPPEEPGVTVVPIPMESGDSGGQQQAPAGVSGGAIAGTPAYLTFNPDVNKFYGATSHFNVVI